MYAVVERRVGYRHNSLHTRHMPCMHGFSTAIIERTQPIHHYIDYPFNTPSAATRHTGKGGMSCCGCPTDAWMQNDRTFQIRYLSSLPISIHIIIWISYDTCCCPGLLKSLIIFAPYTFGYLGPSLFRRHNFRAVQM